jgi:Tfp pilus assembly protein PilX
MYYDYRKYLKKMKHNKENLANDQSGLASIFVTMIMMTVVVLIVLGFVQLSNREQGNALDKQLSSAAFYAAESGINEAKDVFKTNGYGFINLSKSSCAPNATYPQTIAGSVPTSNVKITCLIVNKNPTGITFDNILLQHYKVSSIQQASLLPINMINIYWKNSSPTNPITAGCFNSPPKNLPSSIAPSCEAGMLQVDVVSSTALNTSYTFYVYPSDSIGSVPTISAALYNGHEVAAYCTSGGSPPDRCGINISTPTPVSNLYYVRVVPFYAPAKVDVFVNNMLTGNTLVNGQVVIDSTGQAGSVIQRIRAVVSVGAADKNDVPIDPLSSSSNICKQFYYVSSTTIPYTINNTPLCLF